MRGGSTITHNVTLTSCHGITEIHPYNVQTRAVEYAQSQGVAVTAYSSFGPLGFRELNSPKSLRTQPLFTHPMVCSIAEAHSVTSAQVILRWATQRGLAIIPKSDTEEQMLQNLRSVDISLTEEEMSAISDLNVGLRFNDPADVSFRCIVRYEYNDLDDGCS